jgi:hypothetical protein
MIDLFSNYITLLDNNLILLTDYFIQYVNKKYQNFNNTQFL